MNISVNWILLLIILQLSGSLNSNFIYTELDGDIVNSKINFTVYIINGSGVIFYSYEINNRFLIKMDEENKRKTLTFKFNQYLNSETLEMTKLCGCSVCLNVLLTIILQLEKNEIIGRCNGKYFLLELKNETKNDHFLHYPIPMNKIKNKIFIMMGNIGPFDGFGHNHYPPLTAQIIGCLDSFFFKNKLIKMKNSTQEFSSNCLVNYNETVCSNKRCYDQEISYKKYDCSIFSLNAKYCQFKLEEYLNKRIELKKIYKNERNFFFKLNWKKRIANTRVKYCLMEFVLQDNSLLLFHVNEKNILILSKMARHVGIYQNIHVFDIFGISNILLISFHGNHFTIKIYDGYNIKTYSDSISVDVILVNFGYFQNTETLSEFSGEFYIEYNKTVWAHSFDTISTTTTRESIFIEKSNYSFVLILIGVFAIFLIILTLVGIYTFSKRRIKSNSDVTFKTTRSKTPSPNHYEYELTVNPFEEKGNVGMLVNEEINNTTDDVYEKIS